MALLLVFLPLVNFILFLTFGRICDRKTLSNYAIAGMVLLLIILALHAPAVLAGDTQIASLGT